MDCPACQAPLLWDSQAKILEFYLPPPRGGCPTCSAATSHLQLAGMPPACLGTLGLTGTQHWARARDNTRPLPLKLRPQNNVSGCMFSEFGVPGADRSQQAITATGPRHAVFSAAHWLAPMETYVLARHHQEVEQWLPGAAQTSRLKKTRFSSAE